MRKISPNHGVVYPYTSLVPGSYDDDIDRKSNF